MISRFLSILGALLPLNGIACAGPNPESIFTLEMKDRLSAANPSSNFEIEGPLSILGTDTEGNESHFYVGRVFEFCRMNPAEECEATKQHFVDTVAHFVPGERTITVDQLRIVIRPAEYLEDLEEIVGSATTADQARISRPIAPGLSAIMMAHHSPTISMVSRGHLQELGVDENEAWTIAEGRVLNSLPAVPNLADFQSGSFIVADTDHAQSIMLASDGWNDLAEQTGGRFVIAVPDDGFLIAILLDAIPNMSRIQNMTRDAYRSASRPISPHLFTWSNGRWELIAEE